MKRTILEKHLTTILQTRTKDEKIEETVGRILDALPKDCLKRKEDERTKG